MTDLEIPESGAVFTFGKSRFADNKPSHFFIKNDPVVHIACGDEHTAVICQNGRVFSFGSNEWGQLGLGHTNLVHKPSCMKSLKPEKATNIACGRAHTLVLTEDSNLYACGSNTDGQLGLENLDMVSNPTKINDEPFDLERVVKIAAGSQHSVALTDEGKVFVWGSNSEGQLGFESSRSNLKLPTKLEFSEKVVDISCGYYHTALVTETGDLYMFGENENGKLGIPTSDNHYRPTKVSTPEPLATISCGGNHSAALTKTGNDALVFGSNQLGELGLPRNVHWATQPILLARELFHGEKIKIVACGENHTAFITESNKLYTCGDNRHGKLCLEETDEPSPEGPQLVKKFENYHVTNAACGGCHTIICAQKTEEEFKKSPNLPPLQRVPNAIIHEDSLHKIKSDSIDSVDPTITKQVENGVNDTKPTENGVNDTKPPENDLIDTKPPENGLNDTKPPENGVKKIINDVKTPIQAFTTEVSDGIEDITSTLNETIISKRGELTNVLDSSMHKIEDQINDVKDNIASKIEGIKNGINQNMENITSKTENFMHGMKEKVETSTNERIEGFVKETKDGIGSEVEKLASMTGVKSFLGNSKSDSIENLLDEINDDNKSSDDTVSMISNGKNEKDMDKKKTFKDIAKDNISSPSEEDDVKTMPTEKRLTRFLNTFKRKKIVATAFNCKKMNTDKDVAIIKTEDGEEIDKTKACTIL